MTLQDMQSTMNIATAGSQLIGNRPLFELARTGSGGRLLLKMEQLNPTGSCKVRMAREMILAAERDGRLKPGGRIVESSSGNTGTGLAFVAIERGYKFIAVVDNNAARAKLSAMKALGAELGSSAVKEAIQPARSSVCGSQARSPILKVLSGRTSTTTPITISDTPALRRS